MVTAIVKTEGGRQTVSLPEGFLVESSEVILKRIGRTVLLIPKDANPWEAFENTLEFATDDFMRERDQPLDQPREATFE